MANFVKRPSVKTEKHGGIMAYSKDERFTETICTSCKKNPLTKAQLDFCVKRGMPELCYTCQRSEGYIK